MKNKYNWGVFLLGILIMCAGAYFLHQHYERWKFNEEHGYYPPYDVEELSHGKSGAVIYALLKRTWWTPILVTILGLFMCISAFKSDSNEIDNKK